MAEFFFSASKIENRGVELVATDPTQSWNSPSGLIWVEG